MLAGYVFNQPNITPEQLLGLAKLSWITKSYDGDNAAYIRSTKIPALEGILSTDYSGASLRDISIDVARQLGEALGSDLQIEVKE